jgi:hypothetical protein
MVVEKVDKAYSGVFYQEQSRANYRDEIDILIDLTALLRCTVR